jgi:SAM-dependent methyltransferase
MRDLSAFDDQSFDFAFGSNNVIDAISHEDRILSLGELHRTLRHGGLLAFTSHNRQYRGASQGPVIAFSRNPVTQAVNFGRWIRRSLNHAKIKHLRRQEEDYALLNDQGHDFACLHYYIDHATQRRQLAAAGFRVIDVLDNDGGSVAAGDAALESPWLMYVAQRD